MPASASHPASNAPGYTVFYDGSCGLCLRSRRALERLGPAASVGFVNVRDDRAMVPYPMVDPVAGLGQMYVMDSAGRLAGGYDGFVLLAPAVPLLRPFRRVLRFAPVRAVGRVVYRWVARNRFRIGGTVSCEGGACGLPPVMPRPATAPPPSK